MILTSRDTEILADIQSYGLHSTRAIASRHFPGVALTTVLRRLRRLEEARYIQRIPILENGSLAWALTRNAVEKLNLESAKVHFPRFTLDHDLKLAGLRRRLEDYGIARTWRPEHEIRARVARRYGREGTTNRLIPDGLMGVEIDGLKETLAIELELHPKNQRRYRRIFAQYRFKENLWGFWYVVANSSLGRQLTRACRESRYLSQPPYFGWSIYDDVMRDPLNAVVRGYKGERRLGDLWTPMLLNSPAHTPAQGLSSFDWKSGTVATNVSSENESEELAPTGL